MTAAEFRAARLSLWPRQIDASTALGFARRQATISDMETGKAPVTPQTALLMRAYLDGWRPVDVNETAEC